MVLVLKKSKVLVLTKMVLVLKNLQGLGLVGDGLNYITVHHTRRHFFPSFFLALTNDSLTYFHRFLQSSASKIFCNFFPFIHSFIFVYLRARVRQYRYRNCKQNTKNFKSFTIGTLGDPKRANCSSSHSHPCFFIFYIYSVFAT